MTTIELYSIKGFGGFCLEREKIKKKKEAGEPRPWTEDEILNGKKFCNIDRKDDKMSKEFLSMIAKKSSGGFQIMATLFFRITSGNLVVEYLDRFNTLSELIDDNCTIEQFNKNKCNPYQFPSYVKGLTVKKYIQDYLFKNSSKIIETFMSFQKVSLVEAVESLCRAIGLPRHLKFITFQACADLSYLFPDKIDEQSTPYWGIGSIEALKNMSKNEKIKRDEVLEKLKEIHKDWSLLKIEHGLCEYNKYCLYKENKRTGLNYVYI